MDPYRWRLQASLSLFALLIACSAPGEDGPSPSSAQRSPDPLVVRTGRIVFSGDDR